MYSKVDRLMMLKDEVALLQTRIQPSDTGHIHTTIAVLNERVVELTDEINAELYSKGHQN